MKDRRVTFNLKVSACTPHEKLVRIPRLVEDIITEQPSVRFGRAHFRDFADSKLNYEIVYYLLSPDYNLYMDVQQNINLALLRTLVAEEIPLAPN
jgi:small-conductance mechanosensitive channel